VQVALRGGHGCEVEPWDLLVRRGPYGQFGGGSRHVDLSVTEAAGGDQVGDVDDSAQHVLVEPVTVAQPGPAAGAEFVERPSGDQAERQAQVGDAVGALALHRVPGVVGTG
jgi:hypothetical protein